MFTEGAVEEEGANEEQEEEWAEEEQKEEWPEKILINVQYEVVEFINCSTFLKMLGSIMSKVSLAYELDEVCNSLTCSLAKQANMPSSQTG